MHLFQKIFQTICSQALPSECIICEQFQRHLVCEQCLNILRSHRLENIECCRQCGITLFSDELANQRCVDCIENPPNFDQTICLAAYNSPLQPALHQLKYGRRLSYATGLASAWNHLMSDELQCMGADYLLPMPLSMEKLHFRGFNQSWELARRLDCEPTIDKNPLMLRRHHHHQHQASENRKSRLNAIRDVFYIHSSYKDSLIGKTVLVFDDVMTTGASLNEVARILKDNGAVKVCNWVLLRTLRPAVKN